MVGLVLGRVIAWSIFSAQLKKSQQYSSWAMIVMAPKLHTLPTGDTTAMTKVAPSSGKITNTGGQRHYDAKQPGRADPMGKGGQQ